MEFKIGDEWYVDDTIHFDRKKDAPETVRTPVGYKLVGWIDYGGNIWPARKFGVYPFFVKEEI